MKDKLEVAVVQMETIWMEPEKNIEKMLNYLDKILRDRKVDLVVFPELANTGYLKGLGADFGKEYVKKAEHIPGPTSDALCNAAKKHGVHIVVGICQLHPVIPATLYNAGVLIAPSGEVAGVYHKTHIPTEEKHYFYPGGKTDVFQTDIGNIGIVVCYDTFFPELSRILSLKGAEILCCIFNVPKRAQYIARRIEYLVSARATENQNFVIGCSKVGTEDEITFYGHSAIAGPTGAILSQSNSEKEEVIFATLEREILLKERMYLSIFRDRRPDLYSIISQPF